MILTKRRNGRTMTTVHTKHHLGSRRIAEILCRFADSYAGKETVLPDLRGEPGKALTRSQVDKVVRQAVAGYGMDAYLSESAWDEGYTRWEAIAVATWAVSQVRRLYPELDDEELAELQREYAPQAGAPDEDEEAP